MARVARRLSASLALALASAATSSKISTSKVAYDAHAASEPPQPPVTEPPFPEVRLNGAPLVDLPIESTLEVDGRTVHLRAALGEELQITYSAPRIFADGLSLAFTRLAPAVPLALTHTCLAPRGTVHNLVAPDEIASMVAYLAGPEAGFVTGASLNVDGGFAA